MKGSFKHSNNEGFSLIELVIVIAVLSILAIVGGPYFLKVINMARFINIDPEEALESTNKKFIKRFQYMEDEVKENKKSLKKMTLEEMNNYWEKSKKYNG